jgi:hypothetical protein
MIRVSFLNAVAFCDGDGPGLESRRRKEVASSAQPTPL